MDGEDDKPEVFAVNVSPHTALPEMVGVPLNVALSVVNDAGLLLRDAKWVAVSL